VIPSLGLADEAGVGIGESEGCREGMSIVGGILEFIELGVDVDSLLDAFGIGESVT
jgi:hypothetical protein